MSTFSEDFSCKLFEVLLDSCSDKELQELAAEVVSFKATYFRSYDALMRHPFAGAVLNAVQEAAELRNEWDTADAERKRKAVLAQLG